MEVLLTLIIWYLMLREGKHNKCANNRNLMKPPRAEQKQDVYVCLRKRFRYLYLHILNFGKSHTALINSVDFSFLS